MQAVQAVVISLSTGIVSPHVRSHATYQISDVRFKGLIRGIAFLSTICGYHLEMTGKQTGTCNLWVTGHASLVNGIPVAIFVSLVAGRQFCVFFAIRLFYSRNGKV